MNTRNCFVGGAVCCATLLTLQSAPVTVFTTDFNSGVPAEISGVTTTTGVQGYAGLGGFSGNFLRNGALGSPTVLTLTGLPDHDSVDINFLLAVIDSWDGASGGAAPDFFNISIGGGGTTQASFDVFTPSDQNIPGGTTELTYNTARGFAGWNDSAYDFSTTTGLSFPHSASTLTVSFFSSGGGFQGGDDESWALDNLNVVVNTVQRGVPDGGGTLALLVSSVALLGFIRRRS